MQSELKSLSKIFSETIFRIPDYQRGYSWEERHLKDFWNDIDYLSPKRSHYVGVLTLEPTQASDYQKWEDDRWIIESKRYAPVYVVDGQQRLTTAIILLQAILECTEKNQKLNYTTIEDIRKKYICESKDGGISRSYIFGYEKDNPSYEYLITGIFCESFPTHVVPEKTIYTNNLQAAKNYFKERLSKRSAEDIEGIFTKLTQNLLFNIFYIEKELDVFVTFETMNNRGKALSHLELLKNRLIYLSTRFDVEASEKDTLRKNINESWKSVYHHLGLVDSKWVNDDTFLESHFTCYFGPDLIKGDESAEYKKFRIRHYTHDNAYKDYLLDEVFSPTRLLPESENKLTIGEVYYYAQDIKDSVKTYWSLCEPDQANFPDDEKILLSQVNRLAHYYVFLLVVAIYKIEKDSSVRQKFLAAIERVAFFSKFRSYFFSEESPDNAAVQLLSHGTDINSLTLRYTSMGDNFVGSTDFVEAIRSIGKNTGYYGWAGLRYFLYEYEQHLRLKSKTHRSRLEWIDYRGEAYDFDYKSVEHIYPQQAKEGYWRDMFGKYTIPERNILRNSLGNLLPVSTTKNASLSNKAFPLKKGSKQNKVGYAYGCYSEIEVSHEGAWGALQIVARGVHLLNFMEKRWQLSLGSVEDKIKLLGLGFVMNREGARVEMIEEMIASHGNRSLNEVDATEADPKEKKEK